MSFRVGDVVQLKSGGPAMTVTEVNGTDVTCSWFVRDEPKINVYPSDALEDARSAAAAAAATPLTRR